MDGSSFEHLNLGARHHVEQAVIGWALGATREHRCGGKYGEALGWRDRGNAGNKDLLADGRLLGRQSLPIAY